MKNIDKLTQNQVYNDPVKKIQMQMLQEMKTMREGFAQSIEKVCQNGAGGGSGGSMVSKEAHDKLEAENKKLKYRIKHLLRAMDGDSGSSSGPSFNLSIPEGESTTSLAVLQCLFVGKLTGFNLKVNQVDTEAKEVKTMNPLGKYPLLETKDGALAGVVAIVKYMARVSKKLLGDTPQTQAKIDQWINWNSSTLSPLVGQVSRGIFGQEDEQI